MADQTRFAAHFATQARQDDAHDSPIAGVDQAADLKRG
jgi:hypothetical protein